MRERHNWATGKHPKTCTCATCQERRAQAMLPKQKKKRKPKSMRGQKGKQKTSEASSDALAEALDILNMSQPDDESGKNDDQ